ncbi:MAG TPA: acyl-CoA dehydrogenase family protein, partial [Longimicrobiales bacterium]|nr:acyl-CoA dehydrogenase family protein [Longimicrobiales bacterium]
MVAMLSAELRELVGRAREVTTSVTAPAAEADDAEGRWPEATMRALADAGLMGLHVPEELGGHGQGMTGLVAIAETIAQESPSAALCYAMHCVGTAVIVAKATPHQREAYLEPIARGQHITTLALSEPGSGSHFYVPQTQLVAEGDEYVVDGTKSFVTNGGHADSYVLSTVSVTGDMADGAFSCILADADAPGMTWQDEWHGLGMRSNSSRTVRLEGVRLPAHNLLGEQGDQIWYVFEVVAPYFLMAMAGTYGGVAASALELARDHLATRRHAHTGELLGAQPLLSHRLGELWIDVQRTRQLIHTAAARGDAGDDDALPFIFGCKAAAADSAVR